MPFYSGQPGPAGRCCTGGCGSARGWFFSPAPAFPLVPELIAGSLPCRLSVGSSSSSRAVPFSYLPSTLPADPCAAAPPSTPQSLLRRCLEANSALVPQCSSCAQQFMQKKDLQSHMIKLHGAPKPHAVRGASGGGAPWCLLCRRSSVGVVRESPGTQAQVRERCPLCAPALLRGAGSYEVEMVFVLLFFLVWGWIKEQPSWLSGRQTQVLTGVSVQAGCLIPFSISELGLLHQLAAGRVPMQWDESCMARVVLRGVRGWSGCRAVGELPNPALSCGLAVFDLLQVLSVSDRAAFARGVQAPGREAVCLRGVRTQSLKSQRLADAHQGQAQV